MNRMNYDVQQFMNIHHFEELMRIFQAEKREDSSGFDIDKVCFGLLVIFFIYGCSFEKSLAKCFMER
jgi:hypothetical protein